MRALYLVFSNPKSPEVEAAFNDWYTEQHVRHAVALDGWTAGTRYHFWPAPDRPPPSHKYLCVYEWDVEDPQDALDSLAAGYRDGRIDVSDDLNTQDLRGYVYLPITSRMSKTSLSSPTNVINPDDA